jgi:hypothetical protein
MSSMSIMLIKSENIQKLDDVITINKDNDLGCFTVNLRDNNDGNKRVYENTGLSKSMVLDYLHVLLKSIEYDEDGYEYIQFNIPLIPRVYISRQQFKTDNSYQYFKMLSLGLDLLENTTVDGGCKHKSKRAKTENDEYADMPPLTKNDTRYFSPKNTHEYY